MVSTKCPLIRDCHQPFCELLVSYQFHFAFTCKPESHPALYQEVALLGQVDGVHELTERQWHTGQQQGWRYRYATRVPLRADTQPLYVNWCEVTITAEATGERLYHNAWATWIVLLAGRFCSPLSLSCAIAAGGFCVIPRPT